MAKLFQTPVRAESLADFPKPRQTVTNGSRQGYTRQLEGFRLSRRRPRPGRSAVRAEHPSSTYRFRHKSTVCRLTSSRRATSRADKPSPNMSTIRLRKTVRWGAVRARAQRSSRARSTASSRNPSRIIVRNVSDQPTQPADDITPCLSLKDSMHIKLQRIHYPPAGRQRSGRPVQPPSHSVGRLRSSAILGPERSVEGIEQ